MELRKSPFLGGRHVLDQVGALRTGNSHDLERASLYLRDRSNESNTAEIDLAADEVIDRQTAATIGDARRLGTHRRLQERAGGVHERTDAGMRLIQFVLVLLHVIDELLE